MPFTVVYLHGFRSSPASAKATQVRDAVEAMPAASRPRLWIPALEFSPAAAIEHVSRWVAANAAGELAFVGSSLGGYYAAVLAARHGARAVMVNPAVRPYADLAAYAGVQTNLYTGAAFEVKPSHFEELRAMDPGAPADPSRCLLYLQTGDEVLDWREARSRFHGAWQCVEGGGDHAFQGFGRHVPTILRFAAGGFA